MRNLSVWAVAALMLAVTLRYCYLTLKRRVRPVPATWVIIAGTMCLAFITYMTSKVHSWTGNIGNATGVVNTVAIALTVFWVRWKDGELKLSFKPFQKLSLKVAFGITILWAVAWGTGSDGGVWWSNILTQLLMVIGYVVTLQHLWNAEENTEAFEIWVGVGIAMVIAVVPAVIDKDVLAIVYAARATILTLLVVLFMIRVERRKKAQGRLVQ